MKFKLKHSVLKHLTMLLLLLSVNSTVLPMSQIKSWVEPRLKEIEQKWAPVKDKIKGLWEKACSKLGFTNDEDESDDTTAKETAPAEIKPTQSDKTVLSAQVQPAQVQAAQATNPEKTGPNITATGSDEAVLKELTKTVDNIESEILRLFQQALAQMPIPDDEIANKIKLKLNDMEDILHEILKTDESSDLNKKTVPHITQSLQTVKNTYDQLINMIDTNKTQKELVQQRESIDAFVKRFNELHLDENTALKLTQDLLAIKETSYHIILANLNAQTIRNYFAILWKIGNRQYLYSLLFRMPISMQKQFFLSMQPSELQVLINDILQVSLHEKTISHISNFKELFSCLPDQTKIIIITELFRSNQEIAMQFFNTIKNNWIIEYLDLQTQVNLLSQLLEQNDIRILNRTFNRLSLTSKATAISEIYKLNPQQSLILFNLIKSNLNKTKLLELLQLNIALFIFENSTSKHELLLKSPNIIITKILSTLPQSTKISYIIEIIKNAKEPAVFISVLEQLFNTNLLNNQEIAELIVLQDDQAVKSHILNRILHKTDLTTEDYMLAKKIFNLFNDNAKKESFMRLSHFWQAVFINGLDNIATVGELTKSLTVDQFEQIFNKTPMELRLHLFQVIDKTLQLNYFIQKFNTNIQLDVLRRVSQYDSSFILQNLPWQTSIAIYNSCSDIEKTLFFRSFNIYTKYNMIEFFKPTTNLSELKNLVKLITPVEIFTATQQNPAFGYALTSLIYTIQVINV